MIAGTVSQEQVWTQNTPGRFRDYEGGVSELGTKWTDFGDKLAPTISLEEFNRLANEKFTVEVAVIDGTIGELTPAIADLDQKIPLMRGDKKAHQKARNFKESGELNTKLIEAEATLAEKKAELEAQMEARAAMVAEDEARFQPPPKTCTIARYRSATLAGRAPVRPPLKGPEKRVAAPGHIST